MEEVARFLDWLDGQGMVVARTGMLMERSVRCPDCRGLRFDARELSPREKQLLRSGTLRDSERPRCERCDGTGKEWVQVVDQGSLAPVEREQLLAAYGGEA